MSPTHPETELQEILQKESVPEDFTTDPSPVVTDSSDPVHRLASLGGLASTHVIAEGMHPRPSIRELRDRLKSRSDIRKLGGGYYALSEHPAPPLQDWLEGWLADRRLPEAEVLDAIEQQWAHGHRSSIRAWIHQDPGRVRVSQNEVWIFHSRRHHS